MTSKWFQAWNDESGGTLGRIMEANQRRKEKARADQAYRDLRADILTVLLEGIKRTNDLKVHMDACQRMTDEILELFENQNTKTKQGTDHDVS